MYGLRQGVKRKDVYDEFDVISTVHRR